MKNLILLTILLFNFFLLKAQVTEKSSVNLARNFYFEKINISKKVNYKDIDLYLFDTKSVNKNILYRIYKIKNKKGFILVSANYASIPVLGYSLENDFDQTNNLPPNFEAWMKNYQQQLEILSQQKTKTVHPLWEYYSDISNINIKNDSKDVAVLLPCTWNQGCGYNALCPVDAAVPLSLCGRVYTGCVATAMAQVMKYHAFPASGEGSYSYTHYVYGLQQADFENSVYDWSTMSNTSGNAEVAELMYHCGVSVNMNYSPSGSGAYTSNVAYSLIKYFKYSKNILFTYKSSYTDENWAKMLRAELDESRPLVYQGFGSGGHAFNIDGYQGTDYFHLNWGWGGSYNGYFYLNDLTPGSHSYNNSQATIVGVIPRDDYFGLDFSSPIILTSNIPYSGNTETSKNTANKYGNCYYQSTGKEIVHQITTFYPGRISANISNLNGNDLDVFILKNANQDSLIAYGDISAYAENTVPGTYYIVVDGKYAYDGSYTLNVTCPTSDADLIVTNQTVSPNIIDANNVGNISLKIKNIGNASAGSSKLKIYFSDNNIFDISDILVDNIDISALNISEEISVSKNITIPISAVSGTRFIFFVADADNQIVESDETGNLAFAQFTVPNPGIMDCSSAISLTSGVWYKNNTEINGVSNIDDYSYWEATGKEIIYSVTPANNGVAIIEFSEKIPGRLLVFPLSSCNENSMNSSISVWNPEDTITTELFRVFAGVTYYFVVDGENEASGEYYLRVTLPDICPQAFISSWNNTDLCDKDGGSSLYTFYDFSNVQWYKNNVAIAGQTYSNYWATEAGEYKVKITENNCSVFSEVLNVRFSPLPDNSIVTALSDTVFCEGGNVNLNISPDNGYQIQWIKNDKIIEGENSLTLNVDESGIYKAKITNISCSKETNSKQIIVNSVSADFGEKAKVGESGLISMFSCDYNDNLDLSGNGNKIYYGLNSFPEDRFGVWNGSAYFSGIYDYAYTENSYVSPNVFSLAFWFKSDAENSSVLIGFGDNKYSPSTNSDRIVYMSDNGKLNFGVNDGTPKTISSINSYNDNNWHSVVVSLSDSGMKLNIDGLLEAENASVTSGLNITGWWKIAYENVASGFLNPPTNLHFKGQIDEIRIFDRELNPTEIKYLSEDNIKFEGNADIEDFCLFGQPNITLKNTQNFVNYKLTDSYDNSTIDGPLSGNSGEIIFTTPEISSTKTYKVIAQNTINSCELELNKNFEIKIHNLPNINLGNDIVIFDNQFVTLDAGVGFVSYLWNDFTTESNLYVDGNLVGIGIYEYSVLVKDIYNCENSDTIIVTVEAASAIKEISDKVINIFPNPSKGIFNFDFKNFDSYFGNIIISDISGREMKKINNIDLKNNVQMNFSDFGKGIYFAKIIVGKEIFIYKLLIE